MAANVINYVSGTPNHVSNPKLATMLISFHFMILLAVSDDPRISTQVYLLRNPILTSSRLQPPLPQIGSV